MQPLSDEQRAIVEKWQPGLAAMLKRRYAQMSADDLDDIVQEALVGVCRAMHRLAEGRSPYPYLKWTAVGEAQHYLRDRHDIIRIPRDTPKERWVYVRRLSELPKLDDEEDINRMFGSIEPMPSALETAGEQYAAELDRSRPDRQYARIYRLCILEGYPQMTVGEQLGISQTEVMRRYKAICNYLKDHLSADD